MTTAIPHSYHIFGRSYVYSFRQDFKHLSGTESHFKGQGSKTHLSLKAIARKYLSQCNLRSMVRAEGPHNTKPYPRSAGQATSPQNIAINTAPTPPASRRVSPSVDNSRYNGQSPSRTPSDSGLGGCRRYGTDSGLTNSMRCSPDPWSDSDSSRYTSGDEDASDFSSRATSPDTDPPHHDTMVQRKKREIVDSSMEIFVRELCKWFIEEFGVVSHGGGGSGRGTKRSRDSVESKSTDSPFNGAQKRQLDNDDDPLGGGGDDEDNGKGNGGGKKRARRLDIAGLLYACPYFKRDPARWGKVRTCCGPGWTEVHRVKEHVFRKHKLPNHICPRCHATFDAKDALNAHLRASDGRQCTISNEEPPEGIDDDKVKKIRERKKTGGKMTEAQKWEEMFQIIFPDDLIPSPYMDDTDSKPADRYHMTEQMSRAAQYMRRELVPEVRRQLKREVDKEFEGVSERVKDRTVKLVQEAMTKIIRVWEHSEQTVPSSPSSRSSPPAPDSGLATPEPRSSALAPPCAPLPPTPAYETWLEPGNVLDQGEIFSAVDLEQMLAGNYEDEFTTWGSNGDSAYGTHDGYALESNCVG